MEMFEDDFLNQVNMGSIRNSGQSWRKLWTPHSKQRKNSSYDSVILDDTPVNSTHIRAASLDSSPEQPPENLDSFDTVHEPPKSRCSLGRSTRKRSAKKYPIRSDNSPIQKRRTPSRGKTPSVRRSAKKIIEIATHGPSNVKTPIKINPDVVIEILKELKGTFNLNDLLNLVHHLKGEPKEQKLQNALAESQNEVFSLNTEVTDCKAQIDTMNKVIREQHQIVTEMQGLWKSDRKKLKSLQSCNSSFQINPPMEKQNKSKETQTIVGWDRLTSDNIKLRSQVENNITLLTNVQRTIENQKKELLHKEEYIGQILQENTTLKKALSVFINKLE